MREKPKRRLSRLNYTINSLGSLFLLWIASYYVEKDIVTAWSLVAAAFSYLSGYMSTQAIAFLLNDIISPGNARRFAVLICEIVSAVLLIIGGTLLSATAANVILQNHSLFVAIVEFITFRIADISIERWGYLIACAILICYLIAIIIDSLLDQSSGQRIQQTRDHSRLEDTAEDNEARQAFATENTDVAVDEE